VYFEFAKEEKSFFSCRVTFKEWGVLEINTHPS
jgi:hypothetical protein